MAATPPPRSRLRRALLVAPPALLLAALGWLASQTQLSWSGHACGLFLLRGRGGALLEIKDDLFLGDGSRLLAQLWFPRAPDDQARGRTVPRLVLSWDAEEGDGSVVNHFSDGARTATFFSRFEGDTGRTRGLFVGGAAPEVAVSEDLRDQNQSGMALYEKGRWYHLWCNVNEAIGSASGALVLPAQWRFLGSRVLVHEERKVVLSSAHLAEIDGVPLRIERYAYFVAGEQYFKLGIRIVNAGRAPVRFGYVYGDEPWVGHYGSARGNTGWIAGELVETERVLSGHNRSWVGMADRVTGLGAFLEWFSGTNPDVAYFSNFPGHVVRHAAAPLTGNSVFLGLEWQPRTLLPGQDMYIYLAVGWARQDPLTGMPAKPEVKLHSLAP